MHSRTVLRVLALCAFSAVGCSSASFDVATVDDAAADATSEDSALGDSAATDAPSDAPQTDATLVPDGNAPDAALDSGPDTGGCEITCASGTFCSAGACAPGCMGKIVYVSSSGGADTNDGCSPKSPKKTITNALSFLRTSAAPGHAVHVCRGTYHERVVLDVAASLLGGYDCATWARVTGYGAPKFDTTDETLVENGAYELGVETLRIESERITRAVRVDGFTIAGSATGTRRSVGVLITDGASPTISNNKIDGGSASNSAPFVPVGEGAASVGVAVRARGFPELTSNLISGGSGVCPAGAPDGNGSLGIEIAGTARGAYIHTNEIRGGSGTSSIGHGSLGAVAFGTSTLATAPLILSGTAAFSDNVVDGGTGTSIGTSTANIANAHGMILLGSVTFDAFRNSISAGAGNCTVAPSCIKRGIYSTAQIGRIDGNRFFGGVAPAGNSIHRAATFIGAPSTASFTNNMVYAARSTASAPTNQIALEVTNSPGMTVAHNTLFTGSSQVAIGLHVQSSAGIIAEDNIIAGSGGFSYGIYTYSCSGAPFGRLRNNLLVNLTTPSVDVSGSPCATVASLATLGATEALYAKFGTVSGNVITNASCAGESSKCITILTCGKPPNNGCLRSVFAGWTDTDGGYTEFKPGWRLATGNCGISRGGIVVGSPDPAVDFFGTPRVAPTSIGAHELVEPCP